MFRYLHVAETEEEARRQCGTGHCLDHGYDGLATFHPPGQRGEPAAGGLPAHAYHRPPTYDYLAEKRAIIGTPEQCVAIIREFQEAGG